MKHNHRRRPAQTRRTSPSVLERLQVDVAGIDCGAADHFVSVPPDRDPAPVQAFRTFTADLQRLADWLVACGITSVAMGTTGVYWIPVYDILEARGLEVLLVNARHVKHVPGRKSDVQDSEWLRELHSVGLLRGSFRPPAAILALRALLRHRDTLVKSAGTYVQRMQKALIEMTLLLPRSSATSPAAPGYRSFAPSSLANATPTSSPSTGTHAATPPWRRSPPRSPATTATSTSSCSRKISRSVTCVRPSSPPAIPPSRPSW